MLGIYLIVGAFTGIVAGLFGIGGGIIVVPALHAIFAHSTLIPPGYVMHLAIGTSLATMILTTLSGFFAHLVRGAIRWSTVKQLLPTMLIGVIIGAVIANFLPSHYLRYIFAFFLVIISVRIFFQRDTDKEVKPISRLAGSWIAAFIGALSSILGAGGGTMLVPFLMRLQLEVREALGTSLVFGFFTSLVATACFMLRGLISPVDIPWCTGYIYWPAFIGIILSSVLFAPIGVALAHKLPKQLLKRVFSMFLLLIALDMFFFSR